MLRIHADVVLVTVIILVMLFRPVRFDILLAALRLAPILGGGAACYWGLLPASLVRIDLECARRAMDTLN